MSKTTLEVRTPGRPRRSLPAALLTTVLAVALAGCGDEVSEDAATPDAAAPSTVADTAWMDNPPPVPLPARDTVVGVEPPAGTAAQPQAPEAPR